MIEITAILDAQRVWQTLAIDNDKASQQMAIDALKKCADAIAVLSDNLQLMGYPWVTIEKLSADLVENNILSVESATGLLISPILAMFWEIVGGVSLVDLKQYKHVDFWKEHGIGSSRNFSDGIHVDSCDREWVSYVVDDYFNWKDDASADDTDGFLITLSPDGYHKDNISGGAPYGIYSSSSWRPIWQNFRWPGVKPATTLTDSPDFLSYMRTSILECAGFPGFLGIPAFEPLKERLLKGVPLF